MDAHRQRRRSLSRLIELHSAPLMACSFIALILAGTLALMLPVCIAATPITFIDALFTATSAACVTGLSVVDTGSFFSGTGQCLILALIQIGGLGLMTVSILLFSLMGRGVSFRQRLVMQDAFAHTRRGDILHLLRTIVIFTVLAEAGGALLFFFRWNDDFPPVRAGFLAIFHSVSAFCNAGFSLFPDNMIGYRGDALSILVMSALIVAGGIGFPVVHDLRARFRLGRSQRVGLSIQTKTVLLTSAVLIVGGAVAYWLLEVHGSLTGRPLGESVLIALFQSISCRTAGFNSADIGALNPATLAMMIWLMFIGASPGSCGGGVKTTTLALISVFTWNRIVHRKRVNLFHRSVPADTVQRSLSLTMLAGALVGCTLFFILVGDTLAGNISSGAGNVFLTYLFETVSAFGTVGLSMGITAKLSVWGKLLLIFLMLVGRVGILAFSYIIVGDGNERGIDYAEENIMIG